MVLYFCKSAHLVLRQAAAGTSRCGGGFPSVALHTWPNFQVMHTLTEHTGRRQLEDLSCGVFLGVCVLVAFLILTTNNNERLDSPIFAKQGDSGSPNRDGFARSIDVPHCEGHLGTLGKVWVLDWQPQPLIPAAQDKRRENKRPTQCAKDINNLENKNNDNISLCNFIIAQML